MTDLTPALLSALSALPACAAAAFSREEKALPIITAEEENVSVFARADGAPYIEEHEDAVHVYAAGREEAAALARQADEALTALGLRLISCREDFDEAAFAWRRTLRYRCLLRGSEIYQ